MDGTTEPILAILGHPIAGNPSQFAIERALSEMELDWRVLSFDVSVDDIPAALDGFHVLGIRGVLVDPSISLAVAHWTHRKVSEAATDENSVENQPANEKETQEDPAELTGSNPTATPGISTEAAEPSQVPTVDCLYRDEFGRFQASCELANWLAASVDDHGDSSDTSSADQASDWVWLGEPDRESIPICALPEGELIRLPPESGRLERARFVVLFDARELELEDWPRDDGSTLVIDLTEGHPSRQQLESMGYQVIGEMERRLAILSGCLLRWTGKQAPREVLRDALEEYLGV